MSFQEAYEEYKIYASKRHKKQGFETISTNFSLHILPYFKDKKISELTKLDVLHWQNEILDKNFSNNYNRNLYYEFSGFIRYCVYCSYLKENVVLQVEKFIKKFESKEHHVYNIFQFLWFRFHMKDYVIKQYFNFMYFYGTRPSEAMALRFCDIKRSIVHIQHSIERKGNRSLGTTKNQSSIRDLKVSLLFQFRFWRLKRCYVKKFGCFSFDYFVFGGVKPLSPTTIDRYKKKACELAKMDPITQHEFRHSYATRNIHRGVPIDKVSRDMGHSTVSMTVDVYLHQEKKNTKLAFFQ